METKLTFRTIYIKTELLKDLFLLLFFFAAHSGFCQIRLDLNAGAIPKELKENANAVLRNSIEEVEFTELDNVVYRNKYSITILNSSGKDFATCAVYYNPSTQIKELKGAVYDKHGNLVGKIPVSKFKDASAVSDFSLFEDDRVKWFTPSFSDYPYTVEYEYEQRFKNSLRFPSWRPQEAYNISVEKSSYTFRGPIKYPVRIKERNYPGAKSEALEKGLKSTSWKIANLQAIKSELLAPPFKEQIMEVEIAPTDFYYEKIRGSFSNWQQYGKWTYENLLKGRDKIPDLTAAKINDLVKNVSDPKEKAKKIYEYVQSKTRYVSIQIGIGGLQPMFAEEVDRLGYGDCKALTNYTQSLLKIAGIKSHYAELYGDNTILNVSADFSSLQGNHVILCVPFENDTVWLECTSQKAPFGYLGTFTDNRNAILCTENGGIIARTKTYSSSENHITAKAFLKLDSDGNLEGKIEGAFGGIFYDQLDEILESSGKRRNDLIAELYPLNNLEIKKYNLIQDKSSKPETKEAFEFFSGSYASKSTSRLFLNLNKIKPFRNPLSAASSRKNAVHISRSFNIENDLEYLLPENYNVEFLPKSLELKNDFGTFISSIKLEGNKLIYSKKVSVNAGRYPAEKYQKLYDFYSRIEAFDMQKIVLANKIN